MDGHRPQAWILMSQRALNLLCLDMGLAQGDVRFKKGVQHQIELFMALARSIGKF